ncbi:MAG: hypothetical protein ABS75_04800 [Pelagibacterium sp. SCN 63-23]|nr:MAG: hypothetical protein ABS75_04800 [Pelagibacterium sp. SCN 63-23]
MFPASADEQSVERFKLIFLDAGDCVQARQDICDYDFQTFQEVITCLPRERNIALEALPSRADPVMAETGRYSFVKALLPRPHSIAISTLAQSVVAPLGQRRSACRPSGMKPVIDAVAR